MDDNRFDSIESEREDLARYYEGLTAQERRDRIMLVPAYRDAYNELVQAHRTVDQPAYFWERWVPVLGPIASVLYMRLRQYCFAGGRAEDICWPRQDELAQSIGIRNRESLRRSLVDLGQRGFIEREGGCKFVDGNSGKPIRTADRYRVFFEIPLTAEDAAELLIRSVHQIPMGLDHEKAGKLPFGSSGEKAGMPPFRNRSREVGLEKAGIPPFRDPQVVANGQKAGKPPANVNVESSSLETLSCSSPLSFAGGNPAFSTTEALAEQLAEDLEDPGSLNFFRLVAAKMPEGRIRLVLSETLTASRERRLRRSPGAYFTATIRRVAAELGIAL